MNPEIKAKWLEALRSGQYKQGLGKLKQQNKASGETTYCCLGVLCEVMNSSWEKVDYDHGRYVYGAGHITASWAWLPENLRHSAEVATSDENVLVQLNDGKRASFEEIANYIEENL